MYLYIYPIFQYIQYSSNIHNSASIKLTASSLKYDEPGKHLSVIQAHWANKPLIDFQLFPEVGKV